MTRRRGRGLTLDHFGGNVSDMYQMAGVTFGAMARLYLFRHLLTDTGVWTTFGKMLPAIIEAAEQGAQRAEAVEKQMDAELTPARDRFAPLIAFIASPVLELRRFGVDFCLFSSVWSARAYLGLNSDEPLFPCILGNSAESEGRTSH